MSFTIAHNKPLPLKFQAAHTKNLLPGKTQNARNSTRKVTFLYKSFPGAIQHSEKSFAFSIFYIFEKFILFTVILEVPCHFSHPLPTAIFCFLNDFSLTLPPGEPICSYKALPNSHHFLHRSKHIKIS